MFDGEDDWCDDCYVVVGIVDSDGGVWDYDCVGCVCCDLLLMWYEGKE